MIRQNQAVRQKPLKDIINIGHKNTIQNLSISCSKIGLEKMPDNFKIKSLLLIAVCLDVFLSHCGDGGEHAQSIIKNINCSSLSDGAWVGVPGDPDYGTSNFCVMKYEAKNVGSVPASQAAGSPWADISQTDSITACSNLGAAYHLITNDEWMTVAANIANVADNWSGGSVGSGSLNRGHSDGSPFNALAADANDNNACSGADNACDASTWNLERRTFKLSTGEVIWDFGGNLWEWTSYYEPNGKPTPLGFNEEYPSIFDGAITTKAMLVLTNRVKSWWNDSLNSTQGIGLYTSGMQGSGGALIRGGRFSSGASSGIFSADLNYPPSVTYSDRTFRCVSDAP